LKLWLTNIARISDANPALLTYRNSKQVLNCGSHLCLTTKAGFFSQLSLLLALLGRLTQQKKDSLLHTTFPLLPSLGLRRAAKRRYINQWGTKKVVCLRVLGPVVRALP
jgi:hypothetical protein